MRRLIADNHPKTFTDWRELDAAFDRQYELLRDDMTALEFRRVISPAVAAVRCGHTRLSFSDDFLRGLRETARHVPLDIRILHDSLYILSSYRGDSIPPPGSLVISINGRSSEEIIRTIRAGVPADGRNETYKDWQINGAFRSHYLTFIESPDQFEIVFVPPDREVPETVTLQPMTPAEIRQFLDDDEPIDPESEAIEWTFDDSNRYALLRVWFFDYYDDLDRFTEMIDGFFEELRDRRITSLILDLRGNDGGDPYSSAYLLTYLIGEPFRYFAARSARFFDDLKDIQHPPDQPFKGDLYVLVDGGSYSTTGHFCSLLRYQQKGTFIGLETGGSFACHGGYKEVSLDRTGINLLLPHTTFITDVRDMEPGEGLRPDFEIQPSVRDLPNDRDPVLDKAVALIDSDYAPEQSRR